MNGTADCLEQLDGDGDGTPDASDGCPNDPAKTAPGPCGCGTAERDDNGNWFLDCLEGLVATQVALVSDTSGAAGDEFGAALAAEGVRVAVGAPLADVAGAADAGRVRVIAWDGSAWNDEAELLAAAPVANARFGSAVAFDGDVVAVGAPFATAGGQAAAGTVTIFRRGASGWTREATVTRTVPVAGDRFGSAVALRGDVLAVGAPFADPSAKVDAGEVTVFRFDGASWVRRATAVSSPVTAGDRYGAALDLGGPLATPTLAVGATGDDEPGIANCGAVYLRLVAADGTTTPRARLVIPARAGAALGTSVAISAAADWVAAGAPLADLASIGVDAGSLSTWTLAGSSWSVQTFLATGQAANERFGTSIALGANGATLAVGSPGRSSGGVAGRGVATVFSRLGGGSWDGGVTIDPSVAGTSLAAFGTSVAFFDGGTLVGGPGQDPPAGGAVVHFGDAIDCVSDDTDGDGLGDACDACPADPAKIWPETCGCGASEADSDLDGTPDCLDACPADPAKTLPGTCGCGTADLDSDGDTVADCLDADDDDDGVADTADGCPLDAAKSAPGTCGCGVADTDSDSDATPDCLDGCDLDPLKIAPGTCGCGTADVDADADDLVDCLGSATLAARATPPAPALAVGDDYGWSVAADGDVAVVGIPNRDLPLKVDAGAAVVLRRVAGAWTVEATLVASDARKQDRFGTAVAISGDVVAVGAPAVDVGAVKDAGATYVFRRTGGVWTEEARLVRPAPANLDRFGDSVALRGDFLAVGVPLANPSGLIDAGEVRVYGFAASAWSPRSTLVSSSPTAGDRFGQSVALGGSVASPTLAVGAPGDDEGAETGCGAVLVSTLDADGVPVTTARLLAAAPQKNAALGTSVAVDADGSTVAAGSPLATVAGVGLKAGLVIAWRQEQSWSPVTIVPAGAGAGDQFGTSIALSPDGDWLVAGSPSDAVGGVAGRGSATACGRVGTAWSTVDRLTLPTTGTGASQFGRGVAVAGVEVLVGGPKHDTRGTVRAFEAPSP